MTPNDDLNRLGEPPADAAQALVQIIRDQHSDGAPFGGLASDLVHLAAGQFDREVVRFGAFDQRRSGAQKPPDAGYARGNRDKAALVSVAVEGQKPAGNGGPARRGHVVITAGDVGTLQLAGRLG